jgi:hypothetical protein
MPTPKSAEAFARLVAARARLTEVTKLLNESHADFLSNGQAERQRHAELQAGWDEAHLTFKQATDEFSATIKELHRPE